MKKTKGARPGRPRNKPGGGWSGDALTLARITHPTLNTVETLGQAVGVSGSTISRWENGQAPPSGKADALARALGVSRAKLSTAPKGRANRALLEHARRGRS